VETFRNLWRRKLRAVLTISGIVMGIFALTTMGAMAEHFNVLLAGGITYYGNSIQVADDNGGGYLAVSSLAEIAKVKGVAEAFPSVMTLAKPGATDVVNFGPPDYIANWDPVENRYSAFKISLAQGSWVSSGSRLEVDLGSSLAAEFHKQVGDSIELPVRPSDAKPDFVNHRFTVVGILDQTLTAPDSGAYVSTHDAQMLLGESLPAALKGVVNPYQLVSGAVVYGQPGVNLDDLAERITAEVPTVKATKPSDLVNAFKSGGAIFTFITTAAALLALVIGGLSVVNTMLMSVTERVREIGLKKAIGAKTRNILGEFLAEAGLIGLIGGVVGYLLGLLLTAMLNSGSTSGGLFLITPRLTALSIGFAVALGAVAGLLPAIRAARMDPVRALRAQ
ncbi:MAG TPA: FtsX-like permease family protein, partial [Candidatus Binatia bacterium]|nr:FtsX-like permease family protein [Candidatus Binatia bacterium]